MVLLTKSMVHSFFIAFQCFPWLFSGRFFRPLRIVSKVFMCFHSFSCGQGAEEPMMGMRCYGFAKISKVFHRCSYFPMAWFYNMSSVMLPRLSFELLRRRRTLSLLNSQPTHSKYMKSIQTLELSGGCNNKVLKLSLCLLLLCCESCNVAALSFRTH